MQILEHEECLARWRCGVDVCHYRIRFSPLLASVGLIHTFSDLCSSQLFVSHPLPIKVKTVDRIYFVWNSNELINFNPRYLTFDLNLCKIMFSSVPKRTKYHNIAYKIITISKYWFIVLVNWICAKLLILRFSYTPF